MLSFFFLFFFRSLKIVCHIWVRWMALCCLCKNVIQKSIGVIGILFFFLFSLYIYIFKFFSFVLCRKCGSPYLAKATAATRAALPIPVSVCRIFVYPDNNTNASASNSEHACKCWCRWLHIDCTNSVQESAPKLENPLLHWGIKLTSVLPLALGSNTLPTATSRQQRHIPTAWLNFYTSLIFTCSNTLKSEHFLLA